jgi:hypothetical protein
MIKTPRRRNVLSEFSTNFMQNRPRTLFFALCVVLAGLAHAQKGAPASPPPHGPDTLLFINGEQLTGDLEKADSAGITFKSPMAGEITVQWRTSSGSTPTRSSPY